MAHTPVRGGSEVPAADVEAQADPDPAEKGKWEKLKFGSEVLAVHAALLPTGKVLFSAGSGNSTARFDDKPNFGNEARRNWTSVVWDPTISPPADIPAATGGVDTGQDPQFFHPATTRDAQGNVLDMFCGGETPLPDGRVMSNGGTLAYDPFAGRPDVLAFDPKTEQWVALASMAHGRWYPTVITLGDGRVLAAAGLDETGHGTNHTLESYFVASDRWRQLAMPHKLEMRAYAHLYLLDDGSVCYAGGHMDDAPLAPFRLDVTHSPATQTPIKGLARVDARDQCSSVLLPPAQDQKILIIGGAKNAPEGDDDRSPVGIANVDMLDLATKPLSYHAEASLPLPRKHSNATLLPDRTVLVTGGSQRGEERKFATNQAEIYDPVTKAWTTLAEAQVVRMYHSVALLLPDGRVVTAGGNPDRGSRSNWEPIAGDPNEEMHLEIFSPPYLFRGPRPTIGTVASEWRYGQAVEIASPQAGTIKWASLIRPGATTHSFNTSQRLVDLPISAQGNGVVNVEVTAEPNLAPPGWYMLFLTDDAGIPSIASWVHLVSAPTTAYPDSGYSQNVLGTPGLVSYWPLAERGGTVAFDIAGTQHGSYYNHPRLGKPGPGKATAAGFNGKDQYVLLPRAISDDFSLELWFATRSGGVGVDIDGWRQGAGLLDASALCEVDDFGVSLDDGGQVWAGTGNPDTSIHSGPDLNDGKWHHVVFTRTRADGLLTLFIDGKSVGSSSGGTQALTAAPGLRVGCLQSGLNFYLGSVADAAIYRRALLPAEIQRHFHAAH
jgi:Domain of unknown function (DUF1929)/Concanavalin A-like lectin/glucanases superfamily